MSKQDIEKRLGFAAQGVKAEMASIPGITDLPYEANPQGTHRYKVGDQVKDKRHPSFRGTIKRLMRDKYGHPSYVVYTQNGSPQDAQDSDLVLASRPGAKAKFIRFIDLETWKDSKGTVFTAGIEEDSGNRFQPYVTARDSSGGDQLRTLNAPVFKTEKGARKWLNTWMQNHKSTSSRSGVKAKMGLEMNMLDFRHKFFTAFGAAIRDAKSNPNTAEAQSDEAVLRESWASMFAQGYSDAISDLNGLSATMKSKTSVSQMRKAASDAMETYRQAKAAVRAARPGVKAKFATEVGRKGNKSAMISRDATGTWYAYVVQRIETGIGKDEDMLGTMRAYSTEDRAKRAAIKALDTSGFSRPGVKAKMGSSQVNDSATTADLIREAQRLRDVIKTSNREFDKTHLRQIKQELDRRGVLMPYGASEVLASRSGVKAKA